MLYEIDKGTVSTVDGGKVRVLTADGGITPPLSCSPALLALLAKGDAVVYLTFTDNTGVVVSKGDGTTGGGGSVVVDDHIDHDSENPVQNKVIAVALDGKASAADLASKADATALTAEANRATAAESSLQTAVDGKASAADLSAETSRAEAAEAALQTAVDGKASSADLAAEVSRAEAAESALQIAIDGRTPDFSTTEVKTNRKYKDGKYIYQRTISGTLAVTTSNTYYMLYNQTDLDTLVDAYGRVAYVSGTGYSWFPLPLYPFGNNRYFEPLLNDYHHSPESNRGFKVGARWDNAVTLTYDVTFEYTKK